MNKTIISVIFALLLTFTFAQNQNSMVFLQEQSYDPVVAAETPETLTETASESVTATDINAGPNQFSQAVFTGKVAYLKLKVANTDSRMVIFTHENRDKYTFTVNYTAKAEADLTDADFNDNTDIRKNDYNVYLEKIPEKTTYVLFKITLKPEVEALQGVFVVASVNKVIQVSKLSDTLVEYEVTDNLALKLTGVKGLFSTTQPIFALVTGLPKEGSVEHYVNGFSPYPTNTPKKVQEVVKRNLENTNETVETVIDAVLLNARTLKDSDVVYFLISVPKGTTTKVNVQITKSENAYSLNGVNNRVFSLAKGRAIYYNFDNESQDTVVIPRLVSGDVSLYVVSKPSFEVKSLASYEEQFKDAKAVKSFRTTEAGSLLVKLVANSNSTGSLDVTPFSTTGTTTGNVTYLKLDKDEVKVSSGSVDGPKYRQTVTLDDVQDNEVSYALGTEDAVKLEEGKQIVKDLEKANDNTFKRTKVGQNFAVASIVVEEERDVKDEYVPTDKLSKSTAFVVETKETSLVRVFDIKKGSKTTVVDINVTLGQLNSVSYRVVPASNKNGEKLYANTDFPENRVLLGFNYAQIPVLQNDQDNLLIVSLKLEGSDDKKVEVFYDGEGNNSKYLTGGLFLIIALVAALLF